MIISFFKPLYKTLAVLILSTATLQALFPEREVKTDKKALLISPTLQTPTHSLATWSGILEDPHKFTPCQLITFLMSHTHWPNYQQLCNNAEKVIAQKGTPQEILSWFTAHPPQTLQGIIAYTALLPKSQASKIVSAAWKTKEMSALEEKKFLTQFSSYLSKDHHAARLNHLLWNENIEAAKRLFSLVAPKIQQLAKIRIALMQGGAITKIPDTQDEGVLYELSKKYKLNKNWEAAAKVLTTTSSQRAYADKWWKIRNYIAREFIQLKNYQKAYLVAKKHNLEQGTKEFAEAEWLLGWLSLRFLKQSTVAQRHFEQLARNVKAATSVARAAYWLARTHEAQKHLALARKWYGKGAAYKTTFYGQLSAHKLHQNPYPVLRSTPQASAEEKRRFEKNDLVKAAHLLKKKGKKAENDLVKILTCIAAQATTRAERELSVHLAYTLLPHISVWIARRAGREDPVLLKSAYPTCPLPMRKDFPEKELLFSIARQESDFNPKAISHKGAMGVLQLISSTASQTAKKLGLHHTDSKLFDPAHNILLGSAHVSSLLQKYNHAYLLVTAAYNAGPTPVERWLKEFGDPHGQKIDIIDWVELIPYAETRNYVQCVLANISVYRSHNGTPRKTLVDDLQPKKI